jgi:Rrf2 family protein
MLTLSRKTDYALIALTHLAHAREGCSSAREIAAKYSMPLPLLMNLLKLLTQKGLSRSIRGPRGGYSLAKSPREITLREIIAAVEGPVRLVNCVERQEDPCRPADDPCELVSCCPVRSPIHRIHDRLVAFLDSVTLADLADNTCCKDTPVQLGASEASRDYMHLPRL